MPRVLLLLALIAVVLWWLRRGRRVNRVTRHRDGELPVMTRCAHCGVHLPAAEALKDEAGRGYCSASHRRLGPVEGTDGP